MISKLSLTSVVLASMMVAGSFASAEAVPLIAELKGASEVPPVDTNGAGKLSATYDTVTKELNWTLEYMNLSGPATAAHFHGPAAIGQNAGVVLPIAGNLTSPVKGSAKLTDAQATELLAEK
jgi:ABC-type sulfate transport system permease subunit